MTNKTKKMLSILASTAVLAGFTADIALNSNPTTVNAAKHHKKKKAKKKVKKQTATTGTTSKSKYSSLGAWYLANDKSLYGSYYGKGYFEDGNYDSRSTSMSIYASKADNEYYEYGWIIGFVNGYRTTPTDSELYGVSADKYNEVISLYNSGKSFLKSSNGAKGVTYDADTKSWSSFN